MPLLFILAGAAGSGKSRYRNRLVRQIPGVAEISGDDLIEKWARESGSSYADIFMARKDDAARAVDDKLAEAIANRQDIIWDQTNLTADIRRARLEQIPHDYETTAIGFEAPLGVLLDRVSARNQETGKYIPPDVVAKQFETYERPHFDEGFDHVFMIKAPGQDFVKVA